MAFEYLIAWNLIQRSLDSLVNYIPAFRGMGYQNLPLLYEEALILYAASFETFYTIFYEKYRGRTDLAQDELARSSGDSFYFYYLYGFSGAMGSHEKK